MDEVAGVFGGTYSVFIGRKLQLQDEQDPQKVFIALFWLVKTTVHEALANCAMSTVDLNVNFSVASVSADPIAVKVPVLQNTKPIAAGEELLLHMPIIKG